MSPSMMIRGKAPPYPPHPLVADLRVRQLQHGQAGQPREDAAHAGAGGLVLEGEVVAGEAPQGVGDGGAGVCGLYGNELDSWWWKEA